MNNKSIANVREQYQLTRSELAHILGADPTSLYRWEMGTTAPGKHALRYLLLMEKMAESPAQVAALKNAAKSGDWLLAIHELLKWHFKEKKAK